ncbi:Sugar phosphate permease [Halopenitus malekzadehii]|uniref:Sugar phosphate permease n=1 Tax=Halopenitus malekzadehii TaxID=1267564 RepID=A0A1H6IG81_9EURY|nr:MFS transporter [Halopenitus malekzadehii]SEH47487.1 Sugar phosphate permease [Halopenitus malekzadehii]
MVHTYELAIPIFVTIWLTKFSVIDLGVVTLEVTTATLGVVVTIGYGLFGLGALPGGILVDRIGSRRLITWCLVGMGVSFGLLALAPSVVVITLALVVWGLAASVYHPAGLSLISKGIEERGTGFAYHGIAGNLGIGLGPLIAATLLLVLDWRVVAGVLAIPALFAAVYAFRANIDPAAAVETDGSDGAGDATDDDEAGDGTEDGGADDATDDDAAATAGVESLAAFRSESRALFAGSFALVFLVVMCSGLYYRGFLTFLPELLGRLEGFEPIAVASLLPETLHGPLGIDPSDGNTLAPSDYFYSGLLLVGVIGQYVGGKLTDRLPVEYGIAVGFGGLTVLALVFLPAAGMGLVPLAIVGALMGVFLFVVQPLYQATVAEYTPAGTRGLSYGYTYLGVFGVGALGGAIAGTILEYATEPTLFIVLAGFAAVASITGIVLGRRNAA